METILIKKPLYLIQHIRLVHAITESDYNVCIPDTQIDKFAIFNDYIGIDLGDSKKATIDVAEYLDTSHEEPLTSFGSIQKPLIFPTAITNYCKTLWQHKRKNKYSFQGLITAQRKVLLEKWVSDKLLQKTFSFDDKPSFFERLKTKLLNSSKEENTDKRKIKNFLLWASDRGRKFPIKSWDDDYFKVLANTQFVLCPSGDFIWSYRFFESILCGAIPVIEKTCKAYAGFRFYYMDDNLKTLKWSAQDAEYNYQLCVARLTIPIDELNTEIKRIIDNKDTKKIA